MFTIGSQYHLQVPVQIVAVFRQLVPDSALYTPIDKPLKFSAHKHRSQHWSQKKINQFMLSGCVRTWFSNNIAGTNPDLGRYFYTCLKAFNDWSRAKHFILFSSRGKY